MSAELIGILSVGVALAALHMASIKGLRDEIDKRFAALESRFDALDQRVEALEQRMARLYKQQTKGTFLSPYRGGHFYRLLTHEAEIACVPGRQGVR